MTTAYAILTSDPHTIIVIPPEPENVYLAPNTLPYAASPLANTMKRKALVQVRACAFNQELRLREPGRMFVYPWHDRR